jgi:hypothetical protein
LRVYSKKTGRLGKRIYHKSKSSSDWKKDMFNKPQNCSFQLLDENSVDML